MTDVLTRPADVAAVQISECEWRVIYPSRGDGGVLSLLGFVRDYGGVFEAAAIGRPFYRAYFASLDEAVAQLVR